jgi:hypothetical protein
VAKRIKKAYRTAKSQGRRKAGAKSQVNKEPQSHEIQENQKPSPDNVKKLDVIGAFTDAFNLAVKNFYTMAFLLIISAAAAIPLMLPLYFMKNQPPAVLALGILMLIAGYFVLLLSYITMFRIFDAPRGNEGLWDYFAKLIKSSFSRVPAVLFVSFVFIIFMLALMTPMFVAAVFKSGTVTALLFAASFCAALYLSLRFGQAWIISILEPGVGDCFAESSRIMDGNKLSVVLFALVMIGVMLALELVFMILVAVPMMIFKNVTGYLFAGAAYIAFVFILYPFMTALYYSLYRGLKATKE